MLLCKKTIANADPLHFGAPHEASELVQGKRPQLYTKTSHAFIALGVVVETLQGTVGRAKVELTSIRVPAALAPHPKSNGGKRQPLSEWFVGEHALWDRVGGFSSRAVAPYTGQNVVCFILIRAVSIRAHFLTKMDLTRSDFFFKFPLCKPHVL